MRDPFSSRWTARPAPTRKYSGHPPPLPPRRSRTGLIAGLAATVVALLCLGFGPAAFSEVRRLREPDPRAAGPVLPSRVPAEEISQEPPEGPANTHVMHGGDIRRLMMGPPAGARKSTVETLTVTTATADLAALGLGTPGDLGEEDLRETGFTDGCIRRWTGKDNTSVTVRIYRFDHAGGGTEFANNEVGTAAGTTRRNIAGDPNAAALRQLIPDSGRERALVIGSSSDIAILVTTEQRPPATTAAATSVFSAERKKLSDG